MDRVELAWSGGGMGAGVSVLYFEEDTAASHLDDIKTLLDAYSGNAPSGVTVRVPGSGVQVDLGGAVTGTWSGTAPALVSGSAPATFAGGVGMRIRWYTSGVHNGHKVRGSTFLVPLATGAYQADGSIGDATVNALNTAINTFVSAVAPDFLIWSRPGTGLSGGGSNAVTSGTLVDRVSWLKTRRT